MIICDYVCDCVCVCVDNVCAEDDDEEGPESDLTCNHCIFCSKVFEDVTRCVGVCGWVRVCASLALKCVCHSNLQHMAREHSFFIPDVEFLQDVEGFTLYLVEKVCVRVDVWL